MKGKNCTSIRWLKSTLSIYLLAAIDIKTLEIIEMCFSLVAIIKIRGLKFCTYKKKIRYKWNCLGSYNTIGKDDT